MGLAAGGFLRLLQTVNYAILFCCGGIILGIYSYFLAVLKDHKLPISNPKRAVEGISGAGVLYCIFAVILTCFLGGISVFAFIAIFLDVLFVGGFIALAYLTRHGASSCKGNVNTPLGTGNTNTSSGGFGSNGFGFGSSEDVTYAPKLGLACRLNTACFAVSLIGALFFLLAAVLQVALARHHKKEKKYGPSPKNNYTSGSGKRKFWQRKPKNTTTHDESLKHDAELGAVGAGAAGLAVHHHNKDNVRPSHDTAYTGSTVASPHSGHSHNAATDGAVAGSGMDAHHDHAPHGAHGGYYTQPQGTGVNPYGYDNTANADNAATNNNNTGKTWLNYRK